MVGGAGRCAHEYRGQTDRTDRRTGKKLHTGRSRNDQVATDIRLYLRAAIDRIAGELTRLQQGTIELAAATPTLSCPASPTCRPRSPSSFGHHLLAWNEMLERDYGRLMDCRARLNQSPLGAAALAGTTYPIDRARPPPHWALTSPQKTHWIQSPTGTLPLSSAPSPPC